MAERRFCEDLCEVVKNPALTRELQERIERDEVMFAFAGFYSSDPALRLAQVLAHMILHVSREREGLAVRLRAAEEENRRLRY